MGSHVHQDPLNSGRGVWLRSWHREDGKINFFSIVLLAILAAGVYFAVLLIPPYVEHYKFEEKLKAVANLAHRQHDDEVLMKEIQRECENLGMELPYDAIQIQRDPAHGSWIHITARYIRQVELVPFGSVISMEFNSDIMEQLNQ